MANLKKNQAEKQCLQTSLNCDKKLFRLAPSFIGLTTGIYVGAPPPYLLSTEGAFFKKNKGNNLFTLIYGHGHLGSRAPPQIKEVLGSEKFSQKLSLKQHGGVAGSITRNFCEENQKGVKSS